MLLKDHSYSMIRLLIKNKVQLPARKPKPHDSSKPIGKRTKNMATPADYVDLSILFR